MHKAYLDVMDDVQELLKYALQTDNKYTIALSARYDARE